MASGNRAFDIDSAGCNAKLLNSQGDGKVTVYLLRAHPPHRKEVYTRNVLPKHPSIEHGRAKAMALVVFIKGPRKGELCSVSKVEEDKVWVKKTSKQGRKDEATSHLRTDLALTLQPAHK
jgi:hypothetical protein